MNTTDRIEGESERQLRKWGFELRGSPVQLNASHTVWDHYEDGRIILLYDDGGWMLATDGDVSWGPEGRGTASLMTYLRTAG